VERAKIQRQESFEALLAIRHMTAPLGRDRLLATNVLFFFAAPDGNVSALGAPFCRSSLIFEARCVAPPFLLTVADSPLSLVTSEWTAWFKSPQRRSVADSSGALATRKILAPDFLRICFWRRSCQRPLILSCSMCEYLATAARRLPKQLQNDPRQHRSRCYSLCKKVTPIQI